jgi:cytosine/adenosine deaminase-related metal-dependent hydrolase
VLSYEVTDRNGAEGARAGLAENRRAIAEIQDSQCRAIVGLHASFTLSEESLQAAAAMGAPVHVHVAEGEGDGEDATRRGFAGVVDRLERSGVLRTGSILAHGVHLGDEEVARVLESGCWLVHNPSSNRNNRVGYAHPGRFAEGLALGTDGIGSDMWGAVTEAFLAAREHHHEIDCLSALTGGHRLASQLLGISLGRLEAGFAADLVRLRGPLSTPLTADNLGGHLLFDWDAQRVRDVWVAGEPVLCEGVVLRVDTAALGKRSRVAAEALWGRYRGEIGR